MPYDTQGTHKLRMEKITDRLSMAVRLLKQENLTLSQMRKIVDYAIILEALDDNDGNQVHAAEQLGIHRNTLSRAMQDCGIVSRQGLKKNQQSVTAERNYQARA